MESPGPSFPALTTSSAAGCAAANASVIESIVAVPSTAFPTPKLRLSTSGMLRRAAKSAAYAIARAILPVTDVPPLALFAIFSPRSCAPGAIPSNPSTPNRLWPAAMPAT